MKTKNYMLVILAFLFSASSCKKDSESGIPSTGITYGTQTYTLAKGGFIDYGAFALYGSVNTHFNTDFYTTDGTFVNDTNGSLEDIKGKVVVFTELASPATGVTEFKTGNFTYIDSSNDGNLSEAQLKTKYENKYFFNYGFIVTGTVDGGSLGNNQEVEIKSGTVSITGTRPNYKVTYDLVMEDNKTLKGSYSGTFESLKD